MIRAAAMAPMSEKFKAMGEQVYVDAETVKERIRRCSLRPTTWCLFYHEKPPKTVCFSFFQNRSQLLSIDSHFFSKQAVFYQHGLPIAHWELVIFPLCRTKVAL